MKIKNNKGITLIETIVYVALIGVVLSGVVSLTLSIVDLKVRHLAMRDVIANGRWVNTVVSNQVRQASNVISPALGMASSSLELVDFTGETVEIYLSGDRLWLKENSGPRWALTPANLKVFNIQFARGLDNSRVDNIKYEFSIGTDKVGAYDYSISLNSSVSTR